MIIQSNAHCEGELFETIKSNDSGAFTKYAVENYAVEAFIGKSKVESDKILLNCKVRDAIADLPVSDLILKLYTFKHFII